MKRSFIVIGLLAALILLSALVWNAPRCEANEPRGATIGSVIKIGGC